MRVVPFSPIQMHWLKPLRKVDYNLTAGRGLSTVLVLCLRRCQRNSTKYKTGPAFSTTPSHPRVGAPQRESPLPLPAYHQAQRVLWKALYENAIFHCRVRRGRKRTRSCFCSETRRQKMFWILNSVTAQETNLPTSNPAPLQWLITNFFFFF